MRHRMAGLSAVTMTPGRRGDLPADPEVGAARWQRQQGDRSDDEAAVTDLNRPMTQWSPRFIVFSDPPGQQLPHFVTITHTRQRRSEPARDLPLAEDRQRRVG